MRINGKKKRVLIIIAILKKIKVDKMTTLFEKAGGHDNLERIVAQFYQHILADDRINYFFLDRVSDIVELHSSMESFLS